MLGFAEFVIFLAELAIVLLGVKSVSQGTEYKS